MYYQKNSDEFFKKLFVVISSFIIVILIFFSYMLLTESVHILKKYSIQSIKTTCPHTTLLLRCARRDLHRIYRMKNFSKKLKTLIWQNKVYQQDLNKTNSIEDIQKLQIQFLELYNFFFSSLRFHERILYNLAIENKIRPQLNRIKINLLSNQLKLNIQWKTRKARLLEK